VKILRMPCPKELEKEPKINQMCHELHMMPPPVLRLKMEVFMGGEKVSHYEDRARSWVRNYYNFMTMQTMGLAPAVLGTTYGAGYLTMRRTNAVDQTGTTVPVHQRSVTAHFIAGAGITANGVVVGTGTTAESFESHALTTLIANGTGAGQMDYAAMSAIVPTWDGVTKKFTSEVIRYINNNSGGSITVNEAACYGYLYTAVSEAYYFMLARDLVSPGVAVPNTAQLKVTYTIESATYPV
jgi:hypothetical protein